MLLFWRMIGRIPAWVFCVRPCVMGWRQFELRMWLRLLPRAVRWRLAAGLPKRLTTKDVSPDCVNCARFWEESSKRSAGVDPADPSGCPARQHAERDTSGIGCRTTSL